MMKERRGRIVSLTSIVGLTGNPGQANYAAAKAGILGFTKSLAREIASRGITVNAVAPGFIDTDMTRALNDEQRSALTAQVPMARLGVGRRHRRRRAVSVLAGRELRHRRDAARERRHVHGLMASFRTPETCGTICNSQTTEKQTKTSTHDLTAWRRRKCCPRIRARCGSPGVRSDKHLY